MVLRLSTNREVATLRQCKSTNNEAWVPWIHAYCIYHYGRLPPGLKPIDSVAVSTYQSAPLGWSFYCITIEEWWFVYQLYLLSKPSNVI